MSNKLMGMCLLTSLLLACGATHVVGEEFREQQLQDDGGAKDDGGPSNDPSTLGDAGTLKLCPNGTECDMATEICDEGLCRLGCGSNYPNNVCGQGTVCDDYICRPVSCSAQSPCPAGSGCANGTCVPTGSACSVQSPCPQTHACVQGVCRLWCGPNYPGHICPTGTQCQPNATCQ